jgi:hypothetical protein
LGGAFGLRLFINAHPEAAMAGLEGFSLLGGPFQRLGARCGLVRGDNTVGLGLALGWLSWLILAALAVAEGQASPFFSLMAVAVHARLLLAVPLFFVAETALDAKLREFLALLVRAGIAGQKALPELAAEAARLSRWENSWAPDAASLAAAVALTLLGPHAGLPVEFETGRALSAAKLAGFWYWGFCLPLFRFLMFRWLWRILLWWSLLWRMTKMDLDLSPAHPDRAAGLGYLEIVHTRFAPLALAISIVISAALAEEIASGEATLGELIPALLATFLANCALFLAPPCVFALKLRAVQERGLRDYTVLGARYVHAFEKKWLAGGSGDEPLLGSGDIQSLADLVNSVEAVRKMRLAPVGVRLVASIGAAAALPILPLLLFDYPLADLLSLLVKKLAGL